MKYAATIAALVLVFMSMSDLAQAQQDAPAVNQCFGIVGTSDYYFGEIGGTETVEHTFVFKNNCSETVEIGSARASCGCTAAVLSEKVIPPGGEARIQVKFTPPRGSRGKVTKTVSLYLKDEQQPHTIIRFSAKIKTNLDIQPQYIHLLGAEVGKPITGKATVTNITEKEVSIENISINMTTYADTSGDGRTIAMPYNGATVSPAKMVLGPGQSGDINVMLVPEYAGQVNGAIRLVAGKDEGIIQVFGVVRAGAEQTFRRSGAESGKVMLGGGK
ncbi:MAG: DUF1573 domain-containing protein [Bacteroidota bacterium]|jgi:hypothetical protein|nr:DUF1573 domain-containing protein [Bacteroidota bacterium]